MPKNHSNSESRNIARQKASSAKEETVVQPPIPWDWLDHLRELIILADAKSLRIIKANKICQQILGYTPAELSKLTLESLIDCKSPAVQESFLKAVHEENSIPKTISLDLYDNEGDAMRARVTLSNLSAESEGGILMTALLIPDNLEDPDRLHSLYRKLIECGDGVPYHRIYNCDDFLYISPKCQELLGVSPHELTLSGLRDMIIEQNIAIPIQQVPEDEESQERRRVYKSEIRVLTPQGEDKWIQDQSVLYFDRDGQRIQGTLGILQDITRQKKLESESQRVRIQLQAIASSAHILLQGHNWEHSLHTILGRIGRVLKAHRVFLFENDTSPEEGLICRVRDEWKEEGFVAYRQDSEPPVLSYSKPLMKDCYENLSHGNHYSVSMEELDSVRQKELLQYNTQSMIFIPVSVENRWWGFLELHDREHPRQWGEDELDFLNLMASLIGEALTRHISEEKFRWAHRIYTQAIETARGVPYQFDYETEQYIFVGTNAEEVLGIPSNQLTYGNLNKFIQETIYFSGNPKGTYKEAFKNKRARQYNVDLKIITPSGEERWINDCAVPSIDPLTGRVLGTLGIFHDVTERYENLKKLKEAEEQMSSLINASPDIICLKDGEGRWLLANQTELKLFHLEKVDYIGKKDTELAKYANQFTEAFLNCENTDEKAWNNRTITHSQEIITSHDGTSKILEIIKVPLFDASGNRKKLVVLGHDVTELVKSRDESIHQKNLIQKITDTSPLIIYIYDRINRKNMYLNQSFTDILGYQQEEIKELSPGEIQDMFFDSDSQPGWIDNPEKYLTLLASGQYHEREHCLKTRSGDKRWFILREIMFEKAPDGTPAQILGFGLDITERKKVQDDFQILHQQYQDIISQSQGLVYRYDDKTQTYEFLGKESESFLGITGNKIHRNKFLSLIKSTTILQNNAPQSATDYFDQFKEGKFSIYRVDNQLIKPDGTERWLSDCSIALKDPQTGEFLGALGILQDVTERKLHQKVLETLLKLSEKLLMAQTSKEVGEVLAHFSWDIFHYDAFSFDIFDENENVFKVIYSEDTPRGSIHPIEIGTGDVYAKSRMGLEAMRGKQTLIHRKSLDESKSSYAFGFVDRVSLSLMYIPIIRMEHPIGVATIQSYFSNRFDQNDVNLFQSMVNQTASALLRTMAEQDRRDSERHYRLLADNSMDIITQISSSRKFLYISPSCLTVLGYDPAVAIGSYIYDIVHPDDVSLFEEAILKAKSTHQSITLQYRTKHKQGHYLWLESVIHIPKEINPDNPVEIQCSSRDITQRKNLETQFIHSQKMELVGHFAGGIAHDFNNLLTSVLGNTELLLTMVEDKDPFFAEALKDILDSAQRGATLTRQLLLFARQTAPEYQLYSPKRMLDDSLILLKQSLGKEIEVVIEMSEEDHQVMVDPVQIQQLILNLASNARDSMPAGGKLLIKSKFIVIKPEECINRTQVRPGKFFFLSIKDTGMGMSDEVKEHIFEPFFTTKDIGQGTGLGLSVVDGIVKSHNGWIEVVSTRDSGTEFMIYFPLPEEE